MRSHGKHTRRGLGALIAAGLALGSTAAYAAPITDDNHQLTITDDIQTWRMNGGYLNLTHANGDSEASTSGNTIEVNSRDFNMTDIRGSSMIYTRATNATTAGITTLAADRNRITLTKGTLTHVFGGRIHVTSTHGGAVSYTANENAVVIGTHGTQNGDLNGASIEQVGALDAVSFAAEVNRNTVTINNGGTANNVTAARASLTTNGAGNVRINAADNQITASGGTLMYGALAGRAYADALYGTAETLVEGNQITLTGTRVTAGMAAGNGTAYARSNAATALTKRNSITIENGSGAIIGNLTGGAAYAQRTTRGAAATAQENTVTVTAGTYSDGRDVTGGNAGASGELRTVAATAHANRITLSPVRAPWEEIRGGNANANALDTEAQAVASGNIVTLNGGTFEKDIFGGDSYAQATRGTAVATAESNEVYLRGGTYMGSIYGGRAWTNAAAHTTAIVRGNIVEIAGAPDLTRAQLYGGDARAASVVRADNTLIVRETKNITAQSIGDFQKLAFYVPAGMTVNDTMLRVTSNANTNLSGTTLAAYLPGSSTANRLRLLRTENAQIETDSATTMTVYEGVSGHRTAKMGVTNDKKELVVKVDGSAIDGNTPRIPTRTQTRTRIQIPTQTQTRIQIPTQTQTRIQIPTRTQIQIQTRIRTRIQIPTPTRIRIRTQIPTRTRIRTQIPIRAITASSCMRTRSPLLRP